jgi:mRNA interferase MazF
LVKGRAFVPERGDLVWLTMNPQAGREQSGRRPAVVLSPAAYNGKVGLLIACPVTSRVKGYPFEVALPLTAGVEGVVLADQVKSLDWRKRKAERISRLPGEVVAEILGKLGTLIAAQGK